MLTSEREEARGRASVYSRQHREDINIIGAALIEQADRREWCGEFDDLVEETNRRLHIDLPTRSRSYRIEVPVTVTVALYVTAPDDESAIEAAQEFTSGGRLDEETVEAIRSGYPVDIGWSEAEAEADE